MSSIIRLSRFGKIAALSVVGGSFYVLRDDIKPYLGLDSGKKGNTNSEDLTVIKPISIEKPIIDGLPDHVPYLLIGAGTASHSAMRAIRAREPKAKVLLVGGEDRNPYMRPALSKDLWFSDKEARRNLNFKWWSGKERSIFYEIDEFFIPVDKLKERETGGVSFIKNMRLTKLDPDNKTAFLENGQTIKYDKCLLAPGGRPKSLPVLDEAPDDIKKRLIYFRTADDFLKLDKITETAKSIVIIGGGFLGSELACSLSKRSTDDQVPKDQVIYQIYPESGNLAKVLPAHLSQYLTKKVENEGAKVVPNVEVKSVKMTKDGRVETTLTNNETILADYIICAVGLEPDVELAKSSQLEVDQRTGGYLVNSELEARTGVWVAGDASCYYDVKLGRRRVEHHDHAINSGKLAGQNMIGAGKPYTHQSMFWSDLGTDISFEAVGLIDSSLPTISVFAEPLDPSASDKNQNSNENIDLDNTKEKTTIEEQKPINSVTESGESIKAEEKTVPKEVDKFERGLVFYLNDDNIIVGIVLWNLFGRLSIARRILNEQRTYDDFNEVAKLFNVYLDD